MVGGDGEGGVSALGRVLGLSRAARAGSRGSWVGVWFGSLPGGKWWRRGFGVSPLLVLQGVGGVSRATAGPGRRGVRERGRAAGRCPGGLSPAGGLSEGAPGKQAGCPVRAGVATGKGTGSAG